MTQNKKKDAAVHAAKSIRHTIEGKIAAALAEYKEQIGEKKFDEKIEKAAKLIAKSIKKTPEAESVPAKKTAVRATKKAPVKVAKKTVKKAAPVKAVTKKKTALKK